MEKKQQDRPAVQPDPETLHTTDPEEHMEGPVSSAMQKIKDKAEKNDKQDREENEKEKKA